MDQAIQSLAELLIVAVDSGGHGAYEFVIILYHIAQLNDIPDKEDIALALLDSFAEIHLMVVDVLIKLSLTGNHDGDLADLKGGDKAGWSAVGDDDPGFIHKFAHLGIGIKLGPGAVLGLKGAVSGLDHHILSHTATGLEFIHVLDQSIKLLFVRTYCYKYHQNKLPRLIELG
jgi:hypothetical protein